MWSKLANGWEISLGFLSEMLVHKSLKCKGKSCVQLQDTIWLGSQTCGMWLRQAGIARSGKPFYVSKQWKCREPCLRVGRELVRIRGWTNGRDIMVEKGKPNPTWSWVWWGRNKPVGKAAIGAGRLGEKCADRDRRCGDRSWNKLRYHMSSSPWSLLLYIRAFSSLWCPRDQEESLKHRRLVLRGGGSD